MVSEEAAPFPEINVAHLQDSLLNGDLSEYNIHTNSFGLTGSQRIRPANLAALSKGSTPDPLSKLLTNQPTNGVTRPSDFIVIVDKNV